MIKIAVIDDERHALERFEMVAKEFDDIEICGLFDDDEIFLDYIRENNLDLVFLDIDMPGKNGIQLAEELINYNPELAIVFVTAYTKYAIEAFELNALDYIIKPVSKARLEKTISRIIKEKPHMKTDGVKIYINCFKRFECRVNDEVLPFNSHAKAKELLAFLVSRQGSSTSWEQITENLWEDIDYEKAHNNLYITTYRLRKWLAGYGISQIFESMRNNYRVIPSEFKCDFYEFEKAGTEGDFTRMKALYTGELFEEDGYEWAYPKQVELINIMENKLRNK